jgi:hypothetical protein
VYYARLARAIWAENERNRFDWNFLRRAEGFEISD